MDVSCGEWKGGAKGCPTDLVLKNGEGRLVAPKRLPNWNGESPVVSLLAKVDCATAKVTSI